MTIKTANALALDVEDGSRFVRILFKSRSIGRPTALLAWLNGELQEFLPPQILIAAWGDFSRCNVKSEVVSSLPGIRAAPLGRCAIDNLMRGSYAQCIHT